MTTIKMNQSANQMDKQFQTNMSLYIPHVFENITKEDITHVFEMLRIGKVCNIDFVTKMTNNKVYNGAYIHFEYWYNNIANINLQEKIRNPDKEARIVYDDPWFWLILGNTGSKNVVGERKKCINLDNNVPKIDQDIQNMEEIDDYLEYCEFEHEQELMEDDVYENPSFDYVDSTYASMLETQIYKLRMELQQLKINNQLERQTYYKYQTQSTFIGGCMM
jgi:hypothetical protein